MQLAAAGGNCNILHFHCLFEWKNEPSALEWGEHVTVKLNFRPYIRRYTVKPVLSGHLKIDKTKALMGNGSLMEHSAILLTCIK